MKNRAIVIGAGIVGLAMARSLSLQGWRVTVFEKNEKALGASVRNFGLIWPIGQPNGLQYQRALKSRKIWLELSDKAKFWINNSGALHLAYHELENQVIEEYVSEVSAIRSAHYLDRKQVKQKSPSVEDKNLIGALWTEDEMVLDPLLALDALSGYLKEVLKVEFHYQLCITAIVGNRIFAGGKMWEADKIFVCTGSDFEILYPDLFAQIPITKCKLQMMKLVRQPGNWILGPALCGGLTFVHYKGFEIAPSLPNLKKHLLEKYPEYLTYGIHVMAVQNSYGEIIVGDSHEYGKDPSPFNKGKIYLMIQDYLQGMVNIPDWSIESYWQGIYAKMDDGNPELILKVDDWVTIVNGMGGAGMTLSFAMADEIVFNMGR